MSPKALFCKKNLATMLLTSIIMAGSITGAFIMLTHAAPATTINSVVYNASDPGAGNKTILTVSTNGDFTTTNSIQCPPVQGVPGDGTCYATTSVTASSGITGNVTAVLRGMPTSVLKIYYDAANTVADLNAASISIAGIGDAIGTLSRSGFQLPPPPNPTNINGGILYTANNASYGNKSTLQVEFNGNLTDANKLGSCPAVTGVSGTCYDVAGVTASSGITGVITALMRLDPQTNRLMVVYDSANTISNVGAASITFNSFGNIGSPITSTNFTTPPQNPTAINGGITYTANNAAYGNKSTLQVEFNGNLTDANKLGSCPAVTGVSGTCYDVAGVTASSGITGVITALTRLDPQTNRLMVVYDSANTISNLGATSITFNSFGGIGGPITSTNFVTPPQNPTTINGGILYTADNAAFGNKSTLQIEFNGNLTDANKLGSCPAVTGVSGTCYNVAGVTASLNITGNITALMRMDPTNRLMVVYDAQNVIANMGTASITVNGFGGIGSPITGTNFTAPVVNPTAITGSGTYTASNTNFGNKATIQFEFNGNLTDANKLGSCPAVTGVSGTCYNVAGVTASSNITGNVAALMRMDPQNRLMAVYDAQNVIADMATASITFNGFGGISSPIATTGFVAPAVQNPTALSGSISYNSQNYEINNYKSTMLVTFNQELNTSSGTGSCAAGITQGATCYALSGVTDLSGAGLANGVTKSNITALVQASSYPQFTGQNNKLLIIFNVPNAVSNIAQASITFNNFSGISSPITGTSFANSSPIWHIGASDIVYVESQQPAAFSSVTSAINQIAIKFSGPIDMTTATDANISVFIPGQTPISKTKTISFDQTTYTLTLSLQQAINAGENTLAVQLSNLKAANGTSISNSYSEYTIAGSGSTAPQVTSTSIANNATGVSVLTGDIVLRLDQPLSTPINTTTGITITPNIDKNTPYFDTSDNTLHIKPKTSLAPNTQYQVKIITRDGQNQAVTDATGASIKGMYNNEMANYVLTFTTGGADNTAPRLTWASFKTTSANIGYNIPLQPNAILTSNWTINCGGTPVSLGNASITNSSEYNYLEFKNVTITAGISCTATLSNINGLNGTAFSNSDNVITGTSTSEITYSQEEGQSWGFGMCTGATCDAANKWSDPTVMQWSPLIFEPNIKIQSTEANETMIGFPTTRSLNHGDKIIIELPAGSSINTNTLGVIGTDINGSDGVTLSNTYYGNGKVSVSASSYDSASNKVTLTISIDADGNGSADASAMTNSYGYIEFILKGFVNGAATTYNQANGSGGAYATYKTMSGSTGQLIESGIGQSSPYTVAASGNGSISGSVKDAISNAGIQSVKVMADGPNGMISATTDSSGNYTISNLTNGSYFVFIESNTTVGDYVVSSSQNGVTLADGSNTATGINFKLTKGTKTINVTIQNGSVGSDGTTKVVLTGFNYSSNQYVGKEVTLAAGGTTTSSLKVTPGEWSIGVEYFDSAEFMSSSTSQNAGDYQFMKPQGQIVNVTDASGTQSVTLSLNSTDATITTTVLDTSGNAVASATVYAYRPDGSVGGTQGTTDSNGTCTLKVKNGTYTVGAMLAGAPGMQEQSITVGSNGTTTATFKLNVPSIIITGTVTGDSKEAWIQAYNQSSGFFATVQSNKETGIYSLRVNASTTYTITAYNTNGPIAPSGSYVSGSQNVVSVVNSNITGVNFQYSSGNFGTISGNVSPVESGVRVCAETYNTTTRNTTGKYNCTVTNDSGTYSITTAKNTASERYKLSAYSVTYGNLPALDNIDISSSNASNKTISAGTTYQTSITITGMPSTITNAFFDMVNTSTGIGTSFEIKSFSNGSATKTFSIPQGTYDAILHIQGLGEVAPDTGRTVNVTSNQSLNFTIGNMSADVKTLNVTVKNNLGTALQNAWVEAIDPSNGAYASGITNASGQVSLNIKVATSVTIRADHSTYSSVKTTFKKSDLSATNNVSIELGSQKTSTVSFNVTGTTKSIWVDIQSSDGNFWNGTSLNASGSGSVNVSASLSNATAYFHAQTGETKTVTGISAGQTITVAFSSFSAKPSWMNSFMDDTPNMSTFKPNLGLDLDDSANTGVKLAIGTNAIDTGSDQYSTKIQTVANLPNNAALTTRGIIGKEITFTDANGNIITNLDGEYEISIVLFKAEIDAAKGNVIDSYDDLETMQLGYWDNSTNSYVPESTTKKAYVKENSGSTWTLAGLSTVITNLKTNANYYYDYKIELTAMVNHATIFSPIINSDAEAPSAPAGLTVTAASSTSALLDWNDNSENDLLEYEIYRSATSPVAISNGNQVNTSAVTSSTFTDTTITAGTYYYIVTATDDSGNESTASSERSVTITAATPTVATTTQPSQGSNALPTNLRNDEDLIAGEEESTETDDGGITIGGDTDSGEITSTDGTGTSEESTSEGSTSEIDYENHWAKTYIEKVIEAGIAQGISETSFEPDRSLTRAEMTKMVLNGFDYSPNTSITESSFEDIEWDAWYAPYVESAYELGIINGYTDGTFKPDSLVNRAEAVKIIVNTYAITNDLTLTASSLPFTDTVEDAWYAPYISYAYHKGVVNGFKDGTFKPEDPVTRAEFCKIIVTLLGL